MITYVGCRAVRIRDVDNEKRRHKRLDTFEMWIWKRMEKISLIERIINEEMLAEIGEERHMIRTIRKRRRKWIGLIGQPKRDSLLRTVIEGNMEGKKQENQDI